MRPLNQESEQLAVEPPTLGAVENAADEANILSDQDETMMSDPSAEDPNLGSDGTELDEPGEFARGEIDVKEQMDRTMAAMDANLHRPRDTNITPRSRQVDRNDVTGSVPGEAPDKPVLPHKGGSTGAYTDVGAGRSGVTKSH